MNDEFQLFGGKYDKNLNSSYLGLEPTRHPEK
jgi:hypothetical protein